MEQITEAGLRVAADLSQRYGFSQDAVIHMMVAILRGRGGMAQFSHPEFGGSGQWMPGGMLMIGDMFNHALKARVDGLCHAIATNLGPLPQMISAGSHQSQQQSGGGQQQLAVSPPPAAAPRGAGIGEPLFVADPRDSWWPRELGTPTATGSQNDVRYAYFGDSGRLAVETNGRLSLYDTGDHRISGFAQQQSSGGPVVFSTPGGSVSLASLSTPAGFSHQSQVTGGGSQQQSSSSVPPSAMSSMSPMEPMQPMGGMPPMGGMAPMTPMTPMAPLESQAWWPAELGSPDAAGAQNDLRYAYFAGAGRLAVQRGGRLTIHDVRGHQVQGVAVAGQADDPAAIVVSTAAGPVRLDALPEISRSGAAEAPAAAAAAAPAPSAPASQPRDQEEVLHALERLGELKEKGILSESEFAAKKAELLQRL